MNNGVMQIKLTDLTLPVTERESEHVQAILIVWATINGLNIESFDQTGNALTVKFN